MPVSFDRLHDGEDNEPAPDRGPRPAPGLDQGGEGQDNHADQGLDTRSRAELAEENASLGRAVGELASENADLYKRIDALQTELKASQANTKTEQDKFRAWAKTISTRDAERDLRDEARNKREASMADRLAELERRDADRTAVADSGSAQRLISGQEVAQTESHQRKRPRNRPSNEVIAVGVAWTAIGLSALGELKGIPGLGTAMTFVGESIAAGAAHVALYRKHREGKKW
jgi:hypothetical protein